MKEDLFAIALAVMIASSFGVSILGCTPINALIGSLIGSTLAIIVYERRKRKENKED